LADWQTSAKLSSGKQEELCSRVVKYEEIPSEEIVPEMLRNDDDPTVTELMLPWKLKGFAEKYCEFG